MNQEFARILSLLRKEKGVSQRKAAGDLGISQALLSHYEKGIREPGLPFVVRACDYYQVSADYLLGRTMERSGATICVEELYDLSEERERGGRGSMLALLSKKLLVNSVGMVFELLGKTGSREAIRSASNYLSAALYQIYRDLYHANPKNHPGFFSIPKGYKGRGLAQAELQLSEIALLDALEAHGQADGVWPGMDHDTLSREYPALYQSLFQILHTTGERLQRLEQSSQGSQGA